jgi:hypothetical protein
MGGMKATFTDADVAALLRIAGEAGEFVHDLHSRRVHILHRLLGLVGGSTASCSELGAGYANASGWALPDTITFGEGLRSERPGFADCDWAGRLSALDPCVPLLLERERPVVASRHADGIDGSWYRSERFNEVRRPPGFAESVYGILTFPDGRGLKLTFHREWNDAAFTERDVRLLHVLNQSLAALYLPAPRRRKAGRRATRPQPAHRSRVHESPVPNLRRQQPRRTAGEIRRERIGVTPWP